MEQGSGYQGALLQGAWAKSFSQKHLKPLLAKARQSGKYALLKNSESIALQQGSSCSRKIDGVGYDK
nr:hypothetical protein [Endozoicomonas sp. ONNA2]